MDNNYMGGPAVLTNRWSGQKLTENSISRNRFQKLGNYSQECLKKNPVSS